MPENQDKQRMKTGNSELKIVHNEHTNGYFFRNNMHCQQYKGRVN